MKYLIKLENFTESKIYIKIFEYNKEIKVDDYFIVNYKTLMNKNKYYKGQLVSVDADYHSRQYI